MYLLKSYLWFILYKFSFVFRYNRQQLYRKFIFCEPSEKSTPLCIGTLPKGSEAKIFDVVIPTNARSTVQITGSSSRRSILSEIWSDDIFLCSLLSRHGYFYDFYCTKNMGQTTVVVGCKIFVKNVQRRVKNVNWQGVTWRVMLTWRSVNMNGILKMLFMFVLVVEVSQIVTKLGLPYSLTIYLFFIHGRCLLKYQRYNNSAIY